jgi:chromosome segregation ATPase
MAEEVTENQFAEVLRHLQTLIRKSGEHDKRFDMLDERFAIQSEQLRIIDGRVSDIASKVIEIEKRITVVEAKLSLMETKLTSLENEARQIRLEMNELNESAGMHVEFRKELDQLEVRVFRLEEKLSA